MNSSQLLALMGKTISIYDARTGLYDTLEICDVKTVYGNLRIRVRGLQTASMPNFEGACWFEPTKEELESVK